jgi:hypothetical protein
MTALRNPRKPYREWAFVATRSPSTALSPNTHSGPQTMKSRATTTGGHTWMKEAGVTGRRPFAEHVGRRESLGCMPPTIVA